MACYVNENFLVGLFQSENTKNIAKEGVAF
jgi:hypothetical protein